MSRSGLILVLAFTLLRPGQPAEGIDASTPPQHDQSGMSVCSIDPTWGIKLPEPIHATGGDVRVPKNVDPAFDWSAPCFGDNEPTKDDHGSWLNMALRDPRTSGHTPS
jgi:hypothetical protein